MKNYAMTTLGICCLLMVTTPLASPDGPLWARALLGIGLGFVVAVGAFCAPAPGAKPLATTGPAPWQRAKANQLVAAGIATAVLSFLLEPTVAAIAGIAVSLGMGPWAASDTSKGAESTGD